MRDSQPPTPIRLADYRPPDFLIDTVVLTFELGENETVVWSRLSLRANPAVARSSTLVLDGRGLELLGVRLDGETLAAERYRAAAESLTIAGVPARFELQIQTRLRPQNNTSQEGLYRSKGTFCTQCEAQGFRKITYYLDRPDVLARFTTTLVADPLRYPVLLSNGNRADQGRLEDGRSWVRWEDPFPKPSYLFALVAGDLALIGDRYRTSSGRDVDLRIYVEHHNRDKCDHAMRSLKNAMAWDERRFGREYDLDVYMIVAVDDFNMGAMENKGLNIFNSKYVLADEASATDEDFQAIEGVIGHEYFHNWTGNRVTLRDWFQLSLKEGLTVFRDQEFSSDMGSRAVKRIEDVKLLRSRQFAEDAGPMAHPVRPESYLEINNFYTLTVYEKGAEVIRMLHTLLGEQVFRRGMDLYFERHDGEAVTCDDFVAAMADASGLDLEQFTLWYNQAGTPELTASGEYDPAARRYRLELTQHTPPTPGQSVKRPLLIPVATALLDSAGEEMVLTMAGDGRAPRERVLWLKRERQVFEFEGIDEVPTPSLLRGFSAPVKLHLQETARELGFRMARDTDAFNRWDAAQRYAQQVVEGAVEALSLGAEAVADPGYVAAFGAALIDRQADPALLAEALTLPAETYLAEQFDPVNVEAIHRAREALRNQLASAHREAFAERYEALARSDERAEAGAAVGRRRLRNLCLRYLVASGEEQWWRAAGRQQSSATNMSDELGALRALAVLPEDWSAPALQAFCDKWSGNPLVVDKWLAVQAAVPGADTLQRVQGLLEHPGFNARNPNRVRALIGTFAINNPVGFHRADGAGYRFVAERVAELDRLNPQVAARLAQAFSRWRRYDAERRRVIREVLQDLLESDSLSRDVYEVLSKTLATE